MRRLACAIALVSAAALAYQLLLMRWLAIAHWHPLAVVIIRSRCSDMARAARPLRRASGNAPCDVSTPRVPRLRIRVRGSRRGVPCGWRARFRSTAWSWRGIRDNWGG
jgi:hypothetical protein